ncbi:MAG: hypothetical protein NZT92_02420 [Abditibacteriales bacterium]|nr:hypothetical protein [Abditibacteriales bacterium]MDW8366836.1 hypothetical protein [Abditibacteriales bacterium]
MPPFLYPLPSPLPDENACHGERREAIPSAAGAGFAALAMTVTSVIASGAKQSPPLTLRQRVGLDILLSRL